MDTPRCAALVIACLTSAPVEASGPSHLQQLPSSRVAPLVSTAGQCACLAYGGLREMHRDQALISLTADSARLRIDEQELELPSTSVVTRRGVVLRSFQADGRQLQLRAKQTDFQSNCSIHPDPPTHGSCYDVQFKYRLAGHSASFEGKLICGC
jgi:hypothetical protein